LKSEKEAKVKNDESTPAERIVKSIIGFLKYILDEWGGLIVLIVLAVLAGKLL
jgi:hypothetical protein